LDRKADLEGFLFQFQPDILCINELKLNDEQCNDRLYFKNYTFIFKTRKINPEKGGGVAVLIRQNLIFEKTDLYLNNEDLEYLCINITLKKSILTVVSYYNPRNLSTELFDKLASQKNDILIIGDLNSKSTAFGCKSGNDDGLVLEKILLKHSFIIANNKEITHIPFQQDHQPDILDLAITSPGLGRKVSDFEVISNHSMQSDHLPIKIVINDSGLVTETENAKPFFNFTKADWNKFYEILRKTNPTSEVTNSIVDLNSFISTEINSAAENSITRISFNKKNTILPKKIIDLIKERRRIRKLAKKDFSQKTRYNELSKQIKNEIIDHNSQKWDDFLRHIGPSLPSSRPFWQRINKIRKNKSTKSKIPNLIYEGKDFKTNSEKANLFADLLEFIFKGSPANFNEKYKKEIEEKIKNYLKNKEETIFTEVTIVELKSAIKKLKNVSSPGMTNIHNQFLKNLPYNFLELIVKLVNMTIKNSSLPDIWKIAKITMIPKSDSKSNDPQNFRPISVSCCLGKLIERVIQNRLYNLLEERGFFKVSQSGFRKNKRTHDNLFFMTQKVKESLCWGKKVCCLMFDIKKAFDNVWHDGLIAKLIDAKVPDYLTKWIINFLTNRKFFVQIEDTSSEIKNIEAGVPQGAVLSPLLFNIFINDIPTENEKHKSYSSLFADDLNTFFIYRGDGHLEAIVNKYLDKLKSWLFRNRLEMNVAKCTYTVFSNGNSAKATKKQKKPKKEYNFVLNNEKIKYESHPKLLGVVFDEGFNFGHQVGLVKDKCMKRLNIIKILSHRSWKLNEKTLTNIYKALIGSIIDYNFFFNSCLSETNMHTLQVIQNKALRAIYRRPFDCKEEILCNLSGMKSIKSRLEELKYNYLNKAIINNPFVTQLFDEFLALESSILKKNNKNNQTKILSTPLCSFIKNG